MTRVQRLIRELGAAELARRIGVSAATVRRWDRSGIPSRRADELRAVEQRRHAAQRAAATRRKKKTKERRAARKANRERYETTEYERARKRRQRTSPGRVALKAAEEEHRKAAADLRRLTLRLEKAEAKRRREEERLRTRSVRESEREREKQDRARERDRLAEERAKERAAKPPKGFEQVAKPPPAWATKLQAQADRLVAAIKIQNQHRRIRRIKVVDTPRGSMVQGTDAETGTRVTAYAVITESGVVTYSWGDLDADEHTGEVISGQLEQLPEEGYGVRFAFDLVDPILTTPRPKRRRKPRPRKRKGQRR